MKSLIIRIVTILVLAGAVVYAALAIMAPDANAVPGQCMQSPFGGFCDSQFINPDGSWYHCENVMGWSNCFTVRPVPVEIDPRGWVPA